MFSQLCSKYFIRVLCAGLPVNVWGNLNNPVFRWDLETHRMLVVFFFSIHFGHCEMCVNLRKKKSEIRLSHGVSVLEEKADFALLQKAGKRWPYNASAGSLHLYPTWKWMWEMQAAAPRHPQFPVPTHRRRASSCTAITHPAWHRKISPSIDTFCFGEWGWRLSAGQEMTEAGFRSGQLRSPCRCNRAGEYPW